MTAATTTRTESVDTWGGRVSVHFQIQGTGPALLYLHPAAGLVWDEFLHKLADRYTVYAPILPGIDLSDTMAIHQLDTIHDLVLVYEEALRTLGINHLPIIGESFGGMIAAELAATFPTTFTQLVLLAPAGLWNESAPWGLDFMMSPPETLPALLFKDPDCAGARAMFTPPPTPEQALEHIISTTWTLGCVAKFLWPVPDRGLRRRLHRITAPTQIIWGTDDALIPASYANEFHHLIPHSQVHLIPDCGHIARIEQHQHTTKLINTFLT
jgi:pimeloyl-ACP methyl ester carboxylesterase